jgi:hypothetical protein
MIEWNYLVISLSVLLLFFLVWEEVRRSNKARVWGRAFATIFAVISLACLALPITYQQAATGDVSKEAVLLTDGFIRDSVNKFLNQNKAVPVFTTDRNLEVANKFNAVFVADASFLSQYKDITTFHVFGYGMKKDELQSLKKGSVVFHPTKISDGISSIHWTQKIKTGEKFFIQGHMNNSSSNKAKIVLKSFDTTIDSINVSMGNNQPFELIANPKHAGRTLYSIVVFAGKDTLEKELVPVQVEQGATLRILMLASTPDFENRFLKDRLAQHGYKVVVKTTISKNKFRKDYLNTSSVPVDRINTSLLNNFDITIADATALRAMSTSELATIQAQVTQRSMGLIVKADSALQGASFYGRQFPLVNSGGTSGQNIRLSIGDTSGNMPALPIENLISIRNIPGTQPIVLDKQNRIFVNSTLLGSGKMIVTTITNTFSWALSGYQDDYDRFWSELLNKVAAKKADSEAWSVSPALPSINTAALLQVETNSATVPHAQIGEAAVFLNANADLPFQWKGSFYPTQVGWQTSVGLDGTLFYWYACGKNDWKNIRAAQTLAATQQYVTEHVHDARAGERVPRTIEAEFPAIVFLMLFLLFAGFLWVENKF